MLFGEKEQSSVNAAFEQSEKDVNKEALRRGWGRQFKSAYQLQIKENANIRSC